VTKGVNSELLVTTSTEVRSSVLWKLGRCAQSISTNISGEHVSVFGVDGEGNSFARIVGRARSREWGGSVQSTTGSRGVRIGSSNGSNAGYTMF